MTRAVRVRVSASSANLGPGFDSLGLALDLRDEVVVRVTDSPGVRVVVHGEGAGELPGAESHLVVRSIRRGIGVAGGEQPDGLDLVCHNAIPHGRGLGSSAAAIVAGLIAGRELAGGEGVLDDTALLEIATEIEGHPDNVAAALRGGLTIAWIADGLGRAERVEPHEDVDALVLLPTGRLATHLARAVLPTSVSHADAAANSARAALLVHALTHRPDLLMPGTVDLLHQRQRAATMPETLALVDRLRQAGAAAVVSGAGPSVLVLGTRQALAVRMVELVEIAGPQWRLLTPGLARRGVEVDHLDG